MPNLDIDDKDWKLGVIVGPSGSGKSSIGRLIFGDEAFYEPNNWPSLTSLSLTQYLLTATLILLPVRWPL